MAEAVLKKGEKKDGVKPKKLPVFKWQGVEKDGKTRSEGEMEAQNSTVVRAELRRRGITVVKVKRKPKDLFPKKKPPIKSEDIAVFSRMLATMMSSGVPLMQAMQIISGSHDNESMRIMVRSLKEDVESGTNLAEALAKFPDYFDELYVNLINAGEQSGTLETLLNEIATYKEKTEELKAKVKKALIYPISIIVVAFIVTTILMIFVIPQFETLFAGFGADLPGLTKMVIAASQFFQQYWFIVFSSIGGTVYGIMKAKKKSKTVNHFFDRLMLKIPVMGSVVEKGAVARFARTFATMFKAGVPITEAMDSVAGATGNIVFSKATLVMRDEVATGIQLNRSMKQSKLFPEMVIQMVGIGEESGSLDSMLAKVADIFEAEVSDAVDNMTTLMEPMIMAILGGLIGTLVIAMYLPIFKLGAVVG
jgi:type IV pilus assembly protein PilC